jgi:RNA polymerase sigma-70 factor (ECF subfamily)
LVAAVCFRSLFESHRGFVRRTLRQHGLPASDLADAGQEVFLVVHRRWASYDANRPLRAWLHGICHHVASTRRRQARRRRELLGVETDGVDPQRLPDDHVAVKQAHAIARRAIASIPPERRIVLLLTEVDERPMPEVARKMGIPLNTAYSRLRLARADFRAQALAAVGT